MLLISSVGFEARGGVWHLDLDDCEIQELEMKGVRMVACGRPSLPLGCQVTEQQKDDGGTLYINVGHGGSGFSNGPGHVHKQFMSFCKRYPDKTTPISVVGDGLISRVWRFYLTSVRRKESRERI